MLVHDFERKKLWLDARNGCGIETDYGNRDGYGLSVILAGLLGLKYPTNGFYTMLDFTPELISKLKALAGPHGHTFRKILEARKK